jgi:hypothetical protein
MLSLRIVTAPVVVTNDIFGARPVNICEGTLYSLAGLKAGATVCT